MVAERGVTPLLCYHLFNEIRCTSIAYPISQHIAMLTHYFSDILCEYIKRWLSYKPSGECNEQIDPQTNVTD